jgi:NarL family two-component system response regulator LiaR
MRETARIGVMIVDDHGIVRRGLTAVLRTFPDLDLVGEARNGVEALERCEQLQPDVILMDLIMPEMGGVDATRAIHRQWPRVQIIALTSFQEKELVQEVLQAGAISYLLKNVSGEELADAIRAAYDGRSILAPEAVQALIQSGRQQPASDYDLTPREREVLALLIKGLNNAEIAQRLSISPSTSKAHVSNILSKMGVSNRAEAISLAIQQNLVS